MQKRGRDKRYVFMNTTSFRKLAKGKNKEIGFLSFPENGKGSRTALFLMDGSTKPKP